MKHQAKKLTKFSVANIYLSKQAEEAQSPQTNQLGADQLHSIRTHFSLQKPHQISMVS